MDRNNHKDTCDFESNKSLPHKTIHLTINQGQNNSWNLIWEPYEGFDVSTYYIYRGTNKDDLHLIGTTSGSSSQCTDFSAPIGIIYYQIEVVSPTQCNYSEKKTTHSIINTSRSNIATNSPKGFENDENPSNLFNIYPNPFYDNIYIESKYPDFNNCSIEMTSIDGKMIKTVNMQSTKIEINATDLDIGLYILKIKTDKEIISHKVFKN